MDKLTIIVPCYNEHESIPFLIPALHDVMESMREEAVFEVIMVNNCSEDNTLELMKENPKILGITPAMPIGCSMDIAMKAFPDDVPKPLRKFVIKLLEKKPKNRPVSACDAADQLSRMLLPYPRDLTPYLADWVYSVSQETVSELQVPVTPNRAKRIFATGAASGFILALVLLTLAYLIL